MRNRRYAMLSVGLMIAALGGAGSGRFRKPRKECPDSWRKTWPGDGSPVAASFGRRQRTRHP